jgi:hypothetical protein
MRDQLLAVVTARLERIETARDVALVLEPAALEEARRLEDAQRLTGADADDEAHYVLGWFHWYRYRALPEGQDHDSPLCHVTKEAELVYARLPGSTLLIENPATILIRSPSPASRQFGSTRLGWPICRPAERRSIPQPNWPTRPST